MRRVPRLSLLFRFHFEILPDFQLCDAGSGCDIVQRVGVCMSFNPSICGR